jgi:hypothetical protein
VGALLFVSVSTRPDISFAVNTLAKFVADPGVHHWEAAMQVLKYLGATKSYGILLGGERATRVVAYSDSDWASDVEDRVSVSGGVVYFGGSVICWFSRKQRMVCTSTAEAETHAITDVVKLVLHVSAVLLEVAGSILSFNVENIPVIYTDNQPAIDAINGNGRNKHYDIRIKFVREHLDNGDFKLVKIPTAENVSDILTKPLRRNKFFYFQQGLVCEGRLYDGGVVAMCEGDIDL